jgi:hypothetical protein
VVVLISSPWLPCHYCHGHHGSLPSSPPPPPLCCLRRRCRDSLAVVAVVIVIVILSPPSSSPLWEYHLPGRLAAVALHRRRTYRHRHHSLHRLVVTLLLSPRRRHRCGCGHHGRRRLRRGCGPHCTNCCRRPSEGCELPSPSSTYVGATLRRGLL